LIRVYLLDPLHPRSIFWAGRIIEFGRFLRPVSGISKTPPGRGRAL